MTRLVTPALSFRLGHRTRAFRLVCEYLSISPRGDIKAETVKAATLPQSFWIDFVQIATDSLMGPALALRFEQLGLSGIVPALVERHCHAVLRLNRSRNAQLRAEAIELASELNRIHVVPLFLKGGSGLLSGLYDDPGVRIMGDLDMLVPVDRARDCERLFSELGYSRASFIPCRGIRLLAPFCGCPLQPRSIFTTRSSHTPTRGCLGARDD